MRYSEFFRLATGYPSPYEWQARAKDVILGGDEGVVFIRAGTGSGKTEAVAVPGLYDGRQVIVVEPYRALVEDMEDRLAKMLSGLSKTLGTPYSLAVDYGGYHYFYSFVDGKRREEKAKRPLGADVVLTTIDELVHHVLSAFDDRRASMLAGLTMYGAPVVFFDEAHSYVGGVENPLLTLVYSVVYLARRGRVVVASATLPDTLVKHLEELARLNGAPFASLNVDGRSSRGKGVAHYREEVRPRDYGRIAELALHLLGEHGRILVRLVVPEDAYMVYQVLQKLLPSDVSLGILHGRMPIMDRRAVFKALREDMEDPGRRVVLVATQVIEAGVDLDFDAGIIELTPYRSLEQTIGRINRYYAKEDAEIHIIETDGRHMQAPKQYYEEMRNILREGNESDWLSIRDRLRAVDERYTGDQLSANRLVDVYEAPYARRLAISFRALYALEAEPLHYLEALTYKVYDTRGIRAVALPVQGEPENRVRIPTWLAKELGLGEVGEVPRNMLKPHSYRRPGESIEARGLVYHITTR